MADRIVEILENHINQMQQSVAMMESGHMSTRTNGKDTTQESIVQNKAWIAELEAALERHKVRNA